MSTFMQIIMGINRGARDTEGTRNQWILQSMDTTNVSLRDPNFTAQLATTPVQGKINRTFQGWQVV